MPRDMDADERRAFLAAGTRTGHLATVCDDGRPHVAPVWFVPDGDQIVFTTHRDTVKGGNLWRTGRAAMSVDEPTPPYAFVHVEGPVEWTDDVDELWPWARRIAARYMGEDVAEQFADRNAVPGELLVRLSPGTVVAVADMSQ